MNDFERFTSFISSHQDNIVIYGSGEAARYIISSLERDFGSKIKAVVDRDMVEASCCGHTVERLSCLDKNSAVIIAANPLYRIEERLLDYGIEDFIYIDPRTLAEYGISRDYFNHNRKVLADERITRVKDILADDISKEVYAEMLRQKIEPCVERMLPLYTKNQYFSNDVISNVSGGIIDCGAYDGDTLKRFIAQVGEEEYSYWAFEADKNGCDLMKRFVSEKGIADKVHIINAPVWSEKRNISLGNYSVTKERKGSTILLDENYSGESTVMETVVLDDTVVEHVDLITMDIEGAEYEALLGARGIIERDNPKLAISIYHKTEHFYEIPLLIRSINPDYKLYIRHHRWTTEDTICYAV